MPAGETVTVWGWPAPLGPPLGSCDWTTWQDAVAGCRSVVTEALAERPATRLNAAKGTTYKFLLYKE
jgi:hypothetical protein